MNKYLKRKYNTKERFINYWHQIDEVLSFKPNSIHIFWDAPSSEVWRRQLCPEYKSSRGKKPEIEVKKTSFTPK